MQITSQKGSVVLDYYPIKTWSNNIIPDKFLRILTFKGETQTKRIVSRDKLDEEVRPGLYDQDLADRIDKFKKLPKILHTTQ